MIYSSIVVSIFFSFYLFSLVNFGVYTQQIPEPVQVNITDALHTVETFLKEDGGMAWLSSLTAGRSSPLTTQQLINELLNSTEINEEVKMAANLIKGASENAEGDNSNETTVFGHDTWNKLMEKAQNQEDIICLFRTSLNDTSARKEDWQKFLNSMSKGYIVYLALDMGQKYIICLKKMQLSEQNSTTDMRFLNSTEAELTVENVTSETPLLSSGSRSLNSRAEIAEDNTDEESKCGNNEVAWNRRQFSAVNPIYQEPLPCNRPIIYMLPFGFYNMPWSVNHPTPHLHPSYPITNPMNAPSGAENFGYPMPNRLNFPNGAENFGAPLPTPPSLPTAPINPSYPIIQPLPASPNSINSGFPIMRSANAAPKLPNSIMRSANLSPQLPNSIMRSANPSPQLPNSMMRSANSPPKPPNSNMRSATLPPKLPTPGMPMMRSTAVPSRVPNPRTQYPETTRKRFPVKPIDPQLPNNQYSRTQPAKPQYFQEPPRRFFQPPKMPRMEAPVYKPAYSSQMPHRSPWKTQPAPRSFSAFNDYQLPNQLAPSWNFNPPQYPNFYDQNSGIRGCFPCFMPCNKPLLVRVIMESSRNPSNFGSGPPNNQIYAWSRRNMDAHSGVDGPKNEEGEGNRSIDDDKSSGEKEENSSDSIERSGFKSSEMISTISPSDWRDK